MSLQSQDSSRTLRVLCVEDTESVLHLQLSYLRQSGIQAVGVATASDALASMAAFRPDVALIDLMLPDGDGMDLVERFAHSGDCGIIVVTANNEHAVRVAGLDRGADDWLVKPPAMDELVARVRAVARRVLRVESRASGAPVTEGRIVVLDPSHRMLLNPETNPVMLSEAECTVLEMLLQTQGLPVARERLGIAALKRPLHEDDRSVDQLVLKLRRKLTAAGAPDRTILSSRREGYVIANPGLIRISGSPTIARVPEATRA